MKKLLFAGLLVSAAYSAQAVVFYDNFDGNTNAVLTTSTFSTGATTSYNFWPIGTSGDMGEGFFSVVNRAIDVHSQFSTKYDADNNSDGHYAVYNGFAATNWMAYNIALSGLTVGQQYTFGASFMTLAPDPPYPDISTLRFGLDGVAMGSDVTLTPVPFGSEAWAGHNRTFTATATSHSLSIWSLADGTAAGNDFGIDNVYLDTVPEPTTVAALGLGLGVLIRRKRK